MTCEARQRRLRAHSTVRPDPRYARQREQLWAHSQSRRRVDLDDVDPWLSWEDRALGSRPEPTAELCHDAESLADFVRMVERAGVLAAKPKEFAGVV